MSNGFPSDDDLSDSPENEIGASDELDTIPFQSGKPKEQVSRIESKINRTGLSRYRVEKLLGTGGFSEVYAAYDRQLRREVAFKTTKRVFANREVLRGFLHEARIIAALEHRHILPIYDVGVTDNGDAFVVMKLVASGDLSKHIADETIPRNDQIRLAACIAEALYHAHKNGVIHRDVKPGNILVDHDGHPYLTDFGLALREDSDSEDEGFAGTVPYMSPEQASGEIYRMDGRSDIFSLGAVLYEMLTKKRPFVGANRDELIAKITAGQCVPPCQIDQSIPVDLERIVLKALATRIADRYLTASDFARELRAFLDRSQSHALDKESDRSAVTAKDLLDSDIVISFAQVDDQPLQKDRVGWISSFQKNVALRVEQLMGESVKVTPFPGQRESSAHETLVDSVESAKTLVSVLSPTFTKAKDCQKIVQRFANAIEKSNQHSRLIKVIKTPVDPEDIPRELNTIFANVEEFAFFEEEPTTGRVRELDERLGEESRLKYFDRIYDVADAIYRTLKQSRKSVDSSSSVSFDGLSSSGSLVVYLAETTSDLASDREVLRRELTAKGCVVLPENPLPRTLEEVEEEIQRGLSTACMCIHPIGSIYGLIPEGSQESVVAIQYRLATNTNCPQIIWLPRDRVIKDLRQENWIREITSDPIHSDGLEIIEDRISAVKEFVLHKISRRREASDCLPSSSEIPPSVYLMIDPRDEEQTEGLEDFFYSNGIEVLLPALDGTEEERQQVHLNNLQLCDGALIYFGNGSRHWVDSNARELIKATGYRDSDPIVTRMVYLADPPDKRKERYKSLTTDVVKQGEAGDYSELEHFIEQIKLNHRSRASVAGGRS
jgi:serine/threonine protein kinase